MVWTLPNSSDIFIPDKVSNSAGICAAMAAISPVLLRFGQRLDAAAFHLGGLEYRGDQLALAALDFRFLHLNLRFFLDLLHLHRLGYQLLLHDAGLDVVCLVGLRLL